MLRQICRGMNPATVQKIVARSCSRHSIRRVYRCFYRLLVCKLPLTFCTTIIGRTSTTGVNTHQIHRQQSCSSYRSNPSSNSFF